PSGGRSYWLGTSLLVDWLFVFSFFFSSRRRHTRCLSDWSSDVCSSDLCTWDTAENSAWPLRCTHGMLCRALVPGPRARSHTSMRSEERRVGKECRSGWSAYQEKKKR